MLFALLLLAGSALAGKIRPFPDPEDDISRLPVYAPSDAVPLQCNARQIDNGEHKFDPQGNVVYADFLKCQETAQPLALKYGLNEQIECTVKFEDEIYHLFQLYLHNDAPFSCKVDIKPKSGVSVPIVFQFRGVVEERFRNDVSPVPEAPQPAAHRHVLRRLARRWGRRGPGPRIQTDLEKDPAQRPE
ncbi:hypothetical protein KL931_003698 [Ogataea haglerorum]|nr:hypothetical protein KL913_002269 [Ogataea haglerorum]KAG7766814.1 hypothetical protein KL931_003698 [Ogataea haglerorum]